MSWNSQVLHLFLPADRDDRFPTVGDPFGDLGNHEFRLDDPATKKVASVGANPRYNTRLVLLSSSKNCHILGINHDFYPLFWSDPSQTHILIVYPHDIPMITGPHNLVVNHQFSNVGVSRSPTFFFKMLLTTVYPRSGDIHHINIWLYMYNIYMYICIWLIYDWYTKNNSIILHPVIHRLI